MPMVSNEYEPLYIERKLHICMKTSSYIYMKYAKPVQRLMGHICKSINVLYDFSF